MAHETKIEWTNTYLKKPVLWKQALTTVIPGATFNPWWGCMKVSPACTHCYAEHLSDVRFGNRCWGPNSNRKKFGQKHWNEPLRWNKECEKLGIKRKVFCASMADVFEYHPDVVEERKRLWDLIEKTQNLCWLLLTKRPENIIDMVPDWWLNVGAPKNIWFGTTVENQQYAEERIVELMKAKYYLAAGNKHKPIAFLSMEPLLGPVSLTTWLGVIDWVIVGGESGDKARPSNPDWISDIRDQCREYKVPFFFKQWGEWVAYSCHKEDSREGVIYLDSEQIAMKYAMVKTGKKNAGRMLEGEQYNEMPDLPC